MDMQVQPELVTEREAARYLGLSPATLMKQRSTGAREGHIPPIPYVKLGRRAIRYRLSDLRAYAEKHLVADIAAGATCHA